MPGIRWCKPVTQAVVPNQTAAKHLGWPAPCNGGCAGPATSKLSVRQTPIIHLMAANRNDQQAKYLGG